MHHHHSAAGRLLSAMMLGSRLALFAACIVMLAIFWKSAMNYFVCIARRRQVVFADQLGAGIWLTAAGMVVSDGVRVIVNTAWPTGWFDNLPLARAMAALSIFVILLGYSLHFAAWRAVARPAFKRLSLYWTVGLALLTGAGIWYAFAMT